MKEAQQPVHGPEETRLLTLLRELLPILGDGLNSLGGKTPPTPDIHYLSWTAVSVNHAAGGYLLLRESHRVQASKLLVRPVLEAVFSGIAAVQNSDFLLHKAHHESQQDKKLVKKDSADYAAIERAFEEFRRVFNERNPGRTVVPKKITVEDTAKMAGLWPLYDGAYRVYCQFTHGALRAATGNLDNATDAFDTRTVIWCVLAMLDNLQKHTPAEIPELSRFIRALNETGEV
jgi:hypothetical protein